MKLTELPPIVADLQAIQDLADWSREIAESRPPQPELPAAQGVTLDFYPDSVPD